MLSGKTMFECEIEAVMNWMVNLFWKNNLIRLGSLSETICIAGL